MLLIVSVGWAVFRNPPETKSAGSQKSNGDSASSAVSASRSVIKITDPDRDVADSDRVVIKVGEGGISKISDALAAAKKETAAKLRVIRVPPGRYEERILLDSSFRAGVHFVAEKGEPVILAPSGTEPIIDVSGLERVRIQGFELDASGKEIAMRLTGALPGARFVGLTIRNLNKFGIVGNGIRGLDGDEKQIAFDQITFRAGDAAPVGLALRKVAPAATDPAHIVIAHCRFFGPVSVGVSFEVPVEDVEICGSIFSQLTAGTQFSAAKTAWKGVVHWNNSYFECERAFVFAGMPASGSSGFGFYNNLFVRLKTPGFNPEASTFGPTYDDVAFASMLSSVGGGVANNWDATSDWTAAPTGLDKRLFDKRSGGERKKSPALASLKPDSSDFLAPTQNSPHRSIGKQFKVDKYPEFVGALPPK
jgi:hypothetical protein